MLGVIVVPLVVEDEEDEDDEGEDDEDDEEDEDDDDGGAITGSLYCIGGTLLFIGVLASYTKLKARKRAHATRHRAAAPLWQTPAGR